MSNSSRPIAHSPIHPTSSIRPFTYSPTRPLTCSSTYPTPKGWWSDEGWEKRDGLHFDISQRNSNFVQWYNYSSTVCRLRVSFLPYPVFCFEIISLCKRTVVVLITAYLLLNGFIMVTVEHYIACEILSWFLLFVVSMKQSEVSLFEIIRELIESSPFFCEKS